VVIPSLLVSEADGGIFGLSKEKIGNRLKGLRPALRYALLIFRIVIASCLACWKKKRNSLLEIFSAPYTLWSEMRFLYVLVRGEKILRLRGWRRWVE